MMQNTDIDKNRAFLEMRKPALKRLEGRAADTIAKNAGIIFDKEKAVFHIQSLGQKIGVSYPSYEITPQIEEWHHLILLHYLDLADGTLPEHNLITFAQLKDGMVRGGGFDRQCERTISDILGKESPEALQKACEACGAKMLSSNADFCAEFSFLPLYPVTLKIWFADEEFPASGRLFLDKSADHHLTIEDAVTVGSLVLDKVLENLKKSAC